MPPRRSILLVAHVTPPVAMSAARRPAGLTKYLARLGHKVTVLTSVMCGSGPVAGAERTVRTRDLLVTAQLAPNQLYGVEGRVSRGVRGGTEWRGSLDHPRPGDRGVDPVRASPGIGARPKGALRLRDHELATPVLSHLIGLALQQRGIAWVADLRDGWSFDRDDRPLSGRRRRLDRVLEEAVLGRADGVVGVTTPIADDLCARVNPRAVTITNGFDPDELDPVAAGADHVPVRADRFTVAYTGTLALVGRSPRPLLDAVRELRVRDPQAAAMIELVFAGPSSSADLDQLRAPDLDNTIRLVGALPRASALALQRDADALLLFVGDHRTSVATGKLYEYLSTGRPILVLGEGSAAARIVEEIGAGVVAPVSNPTSIAEALLRLVRGRGALPVPSDGALERFSYPRIAGEMAEQVECAITRRAGLTTQRSAAGSD